MKPKLTREQRKAFGRELRDLNREYKRKLTKLQIKHLKEERDADMAIPIIELKVWYLNKKIDIHRKYKM